MEKAKVAEKRQPVVGEKVFLIHTRPMSVRSKSNPSFTFNTYPRHFATISKVEGEKVWVRDNDKELGPYTRTSNLMWRDGDYIIRIELFPGQFSDMVEIPEA